MNIDINNYVNTIATNDLVIATSCSCTITRILSGQCENRNRNNFSLFWNFIHRKTPKERKILEISKNYQISKIAIRVATL